MKPFNDFSQVASEPFFWWMKANDLRSAAQAIMESWGVAKAAYFDPLLKESGWVKPTAEQWVKLTAEQEVASRRLRFPQVYLFMMGLAFENLIKGLLVARDPNLVKDGKLNKELSSGHSLLRLFNKATIPLTEVEMNFIDRLSDSVLWAGRYPTPRIEDKWEMSLLPSGGAFMPGTFLGDEDVLKTETLWQKVNEVIANDPIAPKYAPVGPTKP